MLAIFEREIKSYVHNIIGYAFIAFMLLFVGIFTMVINLSSRSPNFEYVLGNMSFVFIVLVPILTMRIIAEEKRQKTDQLLYSLPITMTEVVIGKYLALLLMLAIPMVIICIYPLILSTFGAVSIKASIGSIIGFYFLGAALLSMGLFISSITDSQAFAAVLCIIVMLINYYLADLASYVSGTAKASFIAFAVVAIILGIIINYLTQNHIFAFGFSAVCIGILGLIMGFSSPTLEGAFPSLIKYLSVFDRFNNFMYGIFDITAIVYYLMLSLIFVFLTVQSLEKRRWS